MANRSYSSARNPEDYFDRAQFPLTAVLLRIWVSRPGALIGAERLSSSRKDQRNKTRSVFLIPKRPPPAFFLNQAGCFCRDVLQTDVTSFRPPRTSRSSNSTTPVHKNGQTLRCKISAFRSGPPTVSMSTSIVDSAPI